VEIGGGQEFRVIQSVMLQADGDPDGVADKGFAYPSFAPLGAVPTGGEGEGFGFRIHVPAVLCAAR
jgi:hypothetical protein